MAKARVKVPRDQMGKVIDFINKSPRLKLESVGHFRVIVTGESQYEIDTNLTPFVKKKKDIKPLK